MPAVAYRNLFSMGTRVDIILPGIEDELADQLFLVIKDELKKLEDKLSIYDESSIFSKLNKEAASKQKKIDPDIFSLIEELIILSEKTGNYFDFTIGKLIELTKKEKYKHAGYDEELQYLIENTGVRFLKTDPENQSIKFESPAISLNSGAFGKGAALDRIKMILDNWKIKPCFISFGDSSILAHGSHPWGNSWKTGICNMFNPKENAFVLELKDDFMSVSGITPQNLTKYGTGHIINPHTAKPVTNFIQSAAVGKNGLTTEVISTSLLCAPADERDIILNNFPGYRAVIIAYDKKKPEIIY